jgi:hypothetical protein
MFEKRGEKLLPWGGFIRRMALTLLAAAAFASVALLSGVLGYHFIARLSWVDSILNASMILTGMGPVDTMKDTASKLFASAYALFSGVVFISAIGILLSPVVHRIIHVFHIDEDDR